jgi:hypothetical protein
MKRALFVWTAAALGLAALAGPAAADVYIRGPFGGRIWVPSDDDVRVSPRGVVVVPAPPPPPPIMVVPVVPVEPVPRVYVQPVPQPAPQPAVVTAVSPADFARTFKPAPGSYTVTFVHTRSGQPVTVTFDLPAGNPQVSYFAHSLVFDYGRTEVEIRFQVGGKVRVTQR